MKYKPKIILLILIISIIATFFILSVDNKKNNYSRRYSNKNSYFLNTKYSGFSLQEDSEQRVLTRDEAIENYWDEIKNYVDGTKTIDACSLESGNCYSLDADISDGVIETIYFSNGGYLYFSADIDESGNASDIDQNGNSWDFTIDMDSPIIDDAINEWASDNGYIIE